MRLRLSLWTNILFMFSRLGFLRSPQWWLVDWFISCSPLFRKIAEQVIFFDWYIDIHVRYINIICLIYRHILLSQYRVIQFSKNVSILIIPKITYWINYFMLIHTTDTIIPSTNASLCTNNIHTLIYRKHNEFEKKYFLERIVLENARYNKTTSV